SLGYRRLRSDERLLARIAEIGKGRVLTEQDPVFVHDVPAERPAQEMWPLLLAIAVSLVPIDVAVRRLVVDWAAVGARLAAALGKRAPPPAAPAETTFSRLKDAKVAEDRKLEDTLSKAVDQA